MNKFKFSNYKLPHMKSAFLKETKEVQPEINRNFPRLEIKVPEGKGKYDAAVKQTVSSAGGNEATDSIASVKAFNELKQSYMKRKFKGNDERLGPITPEQNLAEYNREKGEFYFNPSEGKLKLIPTDDAEMQDLTGIKPYQLAPKDE